VKTRDLEQVNRKGFQAGVLQNSQQSLHLLDCLGGMLGQRLPATGREGKQYF
jgi:hypothetical protein